MALHKIGRTGTRWGVLGVATAVVGSVAVVTGGLAASAATAPAAPSTTAPLLAAKGKAIPGQYIVVLKRGIDGAAVARKHAVKTRHVYSKALSGFSADLTAAQLAAVRSNAAVAYVVPNGVVSLADKPVPPDPQASLAPGSSAPKPPQISGVSAGSAQTGATWGLDRIDQRDRPLDGTYHYTTKGSGVTAYVIDTGIYTGHSQFGGRAVSGFTAINDGRGTNDCHGHGTHVAGTIGGSTYGVAKAVKLVAVRVLACDGFGTWDGVVAGVDWVTYNHNGPSVANMSLIGGFNQAANDAITNSIAQGVTYAVAAGNSNDDACNYSPASTPGALTLAATDKTDTRAPFSSFGSCVDLFAPGVDVTSAWIGSTTAINTISGTSMATPHVAGLAALYLQENPTATPAVVNAVLTRDAVSGDVTDPGTGTPNLIARKWNGTLSATGAISYQPDGSSWTQTAPGYIQAWLYGTAGTDVDLYLQFWNGTKWVNVARSNTTSNSEHVVYSAPTGDYRLQIYSYKGAGTYDVWMNRSA